MKRRDELGVVIETGPQDWQILQRDAADEARIELAGRWCTPQAHKRATVCVRLAREADNEPVRRDLDWVRATTRRDGSWSVRLRGVPAGGLYRIETALQLDGGPVEWGQRGDMVHHLGVGDVWVLAGQSNTEGHGKSPALDPPALGVHVFRARGRWDLASHPLNDSTDTRYLPNRLGSNPSHSPWLTFGKILQAELGVPIGLIPAALGGSPLSAWTRGLEMPGAGVLFDNLLRYVEDAGGDVRGVVWYQGESDTGPEQRDHYAERFRSFVSDLRRSWKRRDLPVITTQLNRVVHPPEPTVDAGWETMRQTQRQLAHRLRQVFIVSTLDLGLSDGIHTNSLGNVALGQRVAAAALGGAYGRDVKFRHPDCVAVRRRSPKRLELRFENVDERLHFESQVPSHFPFAVRDEAGDVPVASWSLSGPDRFELRLGRPLQGAAVVVGAPTAFPPSIVPQDISGHRPMLAFTQPVEG